MSSPRTQPLTWGRASWGPPLWRSPNVQKCLQFNSLEKAPGRCVELLNQWLWYTDSIYSCVSEWGTLNSSRVSWFHNLQFAMDIQPLRLESLVVLSQWSHHLWTASSGQSRWNLVHLGSNLKFQKFDNPKASWKGLASGLSAAGFGAAWATLADTNTSTQTIPLTQPLVLHQKEMGDQQLGS